MLTSSNRSRAGPAYSDPARRCGGDPDWAASCPVCRASVAAAICRNPSVISTRSAAGRRSLSGSLAASSSAALNSPPCWPALTGLPAAFPDCDYLSADINDDGLVNAFDIDPFVALLVGG